MQKRRQPMRISHSHSLIDSGTGHAAWLCFRAADEQKPPKDATAIASHRVTPHQAAGRAPHTHRHGAPGQVDNTTALEAIGRDTAVTPGSLDHHQDAGRRPPPHDRVQAHSCHIISHSAAASCSIAQANYQESWLPEAGRHRAIYRMASRPWRPDMVLPPHTRRPQGFLVKASSYGMPRHSRAESSLSSKLKLPLTRAYFPRHCAIMTLFVSPANSRLKPR